MKEKVKLNINHYERNQKQFLEHFYYHWSLEEGNLILPTDQSIQFLPLSQLLQYIPNSHRFRVVQEDL